MEGSYSTPKQGMEPAYSIVKPPLEHLYSKQQNGLEQATSNPQNGLDQFYLPSQSGVEQFYYSDIILHQNGVIGQVGDLADVEYRSSIVLLLTGVVREDPDRDKYLLSSELVKKLGHVTRTGVDEAKWEACLPNLERRVYTSSLTLTMKGVNEEVSTPSYESALSLCHDGVVDPVKDLEDAEMAKNLDMWRSATPSKFLRPASPTGHTYRSFNASPTGYPATPPRGFRTVSSTPGSLPSLRSVTCSPLCKNLTLISWAHTTQVCPVCSINKNLWQDSERHI